VVIKSAPSNLEAISFIDGAGTAELVAWLMPSTPP